MILATVTPVVTAAFLSSLVEAVEAMTIVLAVASVRGWRPAALGALAGLTLLAIIVLALGPLLGQLPFAMGVSAPALTTFYAGKPDRQGLILGYAAFDETVLERATVRLAEALRS